MFLKMNGMNMLANEKKRNIFDCTDFNSIIAHSSFFSFTCFVISSIFCIFGTLVNLKIAHSISFSSAIILSIFMGNYYSSMEKFYRIQKNLFLNSMENKNNFLPVAFKFSFETFFPSLNSFPSKILIGQVFIFYLSQLI